MAKTELLLSKSAVSASEAKLIHQTPDGQLSIGWTESGHQLLWGDRHYLIDAVDHAGRLPDHGRSEPHPVAGACVAGEQNGRDRGDQRCFIQRLGGGYAI